MSEITSLIAKPTSISYLLPNVRHVLNLFEEIVSMPSEVNGIQNVLLALIVASHLLVELSSNMLESLIVRHIIINRVVLCALVVANPSLEDA